MKLNNWTFENKLGSGACADVYAIDDKLVIKVAELPRNPKTKKGKDQMRLVNSLYAEYMIYNKINGIKGISSIPLRAYGESDGFRYLVMQRLDKTLGDLIRESGTLPEHTTAMIGSNLLETIEALHNRNIVYVDIKPDNFMLDEHGNVYCVDFGICDSYIQAMNKKHKPQVFGSVVGTPAFLSIDCHQGSNCGRRDDIEALLYVLIYAMKGSLPWIQAKTDKEGAEIKKNILANELCMGLHPTWSEIQNIVRQYSFEEKPDYQSIQDRLKSIYSCKKSLN